MEFLQSFLRRYFAVESVVVSRNVGCFLRLRKRSFHVKRPLTSFRQIIFFFFTWWTYSCWWFLGAVSGSVTPVSAGVFQSMTGALGKPSFSSPRDLFWVLSDKIRHCFFCPTTPVLRVSAITYKVMLLRDLYHLSCMKCSVTGFGVKCWWFRGKTCKKKVAKRWLGIEQMRTTYSKKFWG